MFPVISTTAYPKNQPSSYFPDPRRCPPELTIATGSPLVWRNADPNAQHSATSDDNTTWDSGTLNYNQSYTFSIDLPGDYTYHDALNPFDGPFTLEQWISAYMQGSDLGDFAHNRLRLLIGSGMVILSGDRLSVTPFGMITARLVRLIRFATGIG